MEGDGYASVCSDTSSWDKGLYNVHRSSPGQLIKFNTAPNPTYSVPKTQSKHTEIILPRFDWQIKYNWMNIYLHYRSILYISGLSDERAEKDFISFFSPFYKNRIRPLAIKNNQVRAKSPTEAKCNTFPCKEGYFSLWSQKWKIDYCESSILKNNVVRIKDPAVWLAVANSDIFYKRLLAFSICSYFNNAPVT